MEYKSLNPDDVKVIETIQRRIDSTVEILTSDLKYLIENLEIYKNCTKEMVSSALQETEVLLKYYGSQNNSIYNLPGVFASTVSSYNEEEAKRDNELLKICQDKHASSDSQRSSTYTLLSGTYNEIRSRLNLLAQDNQAITSKLEELKNVAN